jgi:O-antigen/teichoic acid export membrane protein
MVTVVVAASAWPAIRLVFGAAWTGSAIPLMILAAAIVALSIEPPVRVMLMRMHRARWISAAACAGMLINVGLNFLLIPFLGIIGAALASLTSYSFYALLMLVLFGRASGLEIRHVFAPRRDDPIVRMFCSATNRVKVLLDAASRPQPRG